MNGEGRPHLFRSYQFVERGGTVRRLESPSKIVLGPSRIDTKEVCRATSAAPHFFESVKFEEYPSSKFRDGSIWVTDPSMEMYKEVRSMHSDVESPVGVLVSIGCGQERRSILRRSLPGWRTGLTAQRPEQWVIHSILADKEETEDLAYHRFEGPSDFLSLDSSDWELGREGNRTFPRLEKAVDDWCNQEAIKQRIQSCAHNLVTIRQRRAQTTQWERFALGIVYKCQHQQHRDKENSPEFDLRDDFIAHLQRDHLAPPPDEKNYDRIQDELRAATMIAHH